MKILVAEDDENSRLLQHTILEAAGHEVTSVSNGREAFAKIVADRPDAIISDIMMPEMDGYALCRAVKSNPDFVDIPFIFYSATFTSEADRQLAEELGGSQFLVKPMDPDEFMAAIDSILSINISARPAREVPALDTDAVDAKYASTLARKLDKKHYELKRVNSELAATQVNLRHIRESYQLAQKIAHMGIWDWDLASGEFWWSDELYALLDVPPDTQTTRELLLDKIAGHDRKRFELALNMAKEKAIPFHMDIHVAPDGHNERIFRAEVAITSLDEMDKTPRRLVCVMQDITQQRRIETDRSRLETSLRQKQKIEALGSMAGSIAHDFKNLLMVVQAHAHDLRHDDVVRSDDENDQLDQIIAACSRANELAGQILLFSRHEKMAKEPVLLQPVIEEVMKLIRPSLAAGIELKTRLDPQSPPVLTNASQFHQVLMNLCMNAIQALPDSGGLLEVTMDPVDVHAWDKVAQEGLKAGKYVKIAVRDNGRGMDQATRERIFEPYFTTRGASGGTGLGLSVVHGIVLEHNGQIMLNSEPGRGTTFSVYLPVA